MDELNFDVFDDEQKKVLVRLADKISEAAPKDDLGLDDDPMIKRDRANLKKVDSVWRNNGYISSYRDQRVTIDQLIEKDLKATSLMRDNFSTDLPLLIPRVLSNVVREAIEPQLVLTPLMTRINFSAGTRVSFPSFGALNGPAMDLAEGEEYPEATLEMGGTTECIIGKSGIACKVTEEQRRYSQFDIISMNLRQCGRALARHKERKVASLITTNGVTLIDNQDTAYASSTGRNAAGTYNGTLTLDDIFKAWATMVNTGYVPNTLIMHPFAWKIFSEEGMSRLFGIENGMANLLWQMAQGSPGNAPQWAISPLNNSTWVSSPENIATTFTKVPSLFPTSFNIIVSPYMAYSSSANTTDIVLCDVNELGIMVVDEEITSDEWTDPSKDIMKVKFRERYGLAVKNDGKGIGLLKNIKILKSVDFADRISVTYATGDVGSPLTGDDNYTASPF